MSIAIGYIQSPGKRFIGTFIHDGMIKTRPDLIGTRNPVEQTIVDAIGERFDSMEEIEKAIEVANAGGGSATLQDFLDGNHYDDGRPSGLITGDGEKVDIYFIVSDVPFSQEQYESDLAGCKNSVDSFGDQFTIQQLWEDSGFGVISNNIRFAVRTDW